MCKKQEFQYYIYIFCIVCLLIFLDNTYANENEYFKIRYKDYSKEIKLIKITDECIKKIRQFPDTKMIALVCDYLLRNNVSAIGVEIIFDTPTKFDEKLVELLKRTTRIVLGYQINFSQYKHNTYKIIEEPYMKIKEISKTGYVNFNLEHGYINLTYHSFFIKNNEVFLSMPLALFFIKEKVENFEIIKNNNILQNLENINYLMKINNRLLPEYFKPSLKYQFTFETFYNVYNNALKFIDLPNPKEIDNVDYSNKIVIIGNATNNSKKYYINMKKLDNIDILANSLTEIYNFIYKVW